MKTCCGKKRKSRFCPDCGKQLLAGPIYSLLVHVRRRKKQFVNQGDSEYEHTNEIRDKAIKKWTGWEEALEELITNQSA